MNKEELLEEKKRLESLKDDIDFKIKQLNELLDQENPTKEQIRLNLAPWKNDILWQIADIIRVSPILNSHYPYGHDCSVCKACGNEGYATCDCEGWECNWFFTRYFERKLEERKNLDFWEGRN